MKLSVAIITFNEEDNIKRTLDAVSDLADEIVIVDSFSTDATKEIACKYEKVRFYEETFKGDGLQKKSAIDKCSAEWILLLDADEEVSEKLKNKVSDILFKKKSEYQVYDIRLINFIDNQAIRYGGWGNDYKRRLFKKKSGYINPVKVHASWKTKEKVGRIKEPINHYPYKGLHHHLEKLNVYTTEQAKINYDLGKRNSFLKVVLGPLFYFFKMYVLRLGFLDGKSGFYLAVLNYFYAFSKYYKLYMMGKNN